MAFTAGEEAVFQSGGVGTDVPGPLSRGKRNQQLVSRVSGVCSYTTSSCLNPAVVYIESSYRRGLPTIPCVVFTSRAKSFLSCAVQLLYHTVPHR